MDDHGPSETSPKHRDYSNVPLDPQRQIRVLTLLPSEDESSQISCRLDVLTLPAAGQSGDSQALSTECDYNALSYAWGSKKKTTSINVNGGMENVKVTENLWMALVQLRKKTPSRPLWIDQISIDQSNTYERNHQVRLMDRVYSQANRVIVWLGSDVQDDPEYSQTRSPEDRLQVVMKTTPCPWWNRIWIVQEVALAKVDPIVMIGPCEVSWEWLTTSNSYARKQSLVKSARCFRDQRHESVSGKIFLSMLDTIRLTQATDRRDKVYALLSLLDPSIRSFLQPDYNKPVSEVFAEATHASVAASGRFDLLLFASPHMKPAQNSQSRRVLPSWAFNFSVGVATECLRVHPLPRSPDQRILCGRPLNTPAQVHYDAQNRALIVRGKMLDTISSGTSDHDMYDCTWLDTVAKAFTASDLDKQATPPMTSQHRPAAELDSSFPYDELLATKKGWKNWVAVQHGLRGIFGGRKRPHSIPISTVFLGWQAYMSEQHGLRIPAKAQYPASWKPYLYPNHVFVTRAGFMGFGPLEGLGHHQVFLPHGGFAPMLLTPPKLDSIEQHAPGMWEFGGFAFINGIMEGELQTFGVAEKLEDVDVVLI